jgi:hypothetical protein
MPVLSLVLSLLNYDKVNSKKILVLFCGFFGYTFVIKDASYDSSRLRDAFLRNHHSRQSFYDYFMDVQHAEVSRGDYLEPLLSYTLAQLTSDYRILLCAFGLLLGLYTVKNIYFIIEESNYKIRKSSYLYFLFFFLLCPIWNINGFRFFLATHFFMWGIFNFFVRASKKHIFFILLSPLIHISFVFAWGMFFVTWVMPKSRLFVAFFFLVAFSFQQMNLATLMSYLPELHGVLGERLEDYTHKDVVEGLRKGIMQTNWYVRLVGQVTSFVTLSILLILSTIKYNQVKRQKLQKILSFASVAYAFTAIADAVPTMDRFYLLSHLALVGAFVIVINNEKRTMLSRTLIGLLTLPIIFYSVVTIRAGFDFFGLGTLFNNPLIAPFFDYKVPLIDYIK